MTAFNTTHDPAKGVYHLTYGGRIIATANTLESLNTAVRNRDKLLAAYWKRRRRNK